MPHAPGVLGNALPLLPYPPLAPGVGAVSAPQAAGVGAEIGPGVGAPGVGAELYAPGVGADPYVDVSTAGVGALYAAGVRATGSALVADHGSLDGLPGVFEPASHALLPVRSESEM